MDGHDGYGRPPAAPEPVLSRRALLGLRRGARARSDIDFAGETARRRAAWSGVGEEYLRAIEPVAEVLATLAAVGQGDRVLDAGAGDGNVGLACARRGALVEACELAPALAGRGRARTGEAVRWTVADVEALPYADASFDVAVSAFGLAQAPRALRATRELARVLRPGGRLVAAAWSPRGLPGRLDRELPPPDGVPEPSAWADPAVAGRRLGKWFDQHAQRTRTVALAFGSAELMFEALTAPYGLAPTSRPAVRSRFDALLAAQSDVPGAAQVSARYVVLTARRRDAGAGTAG